MPLTTIQFNLPDEQDEFRAAVKGSQYRSALQECDSWLRGLAKYGDDAPMSPSQVRARFWEILAENDADDILE